MCGLCELLKLKHMYVCDLYRPVHAPTAHSLRDLRIIINLWGTRYCLLPDITQLQIINPVEKLGLLTIALLVRKVSIVYGIRDFFLCLQQPTNGLYPE